MISDALAARIPYSAPAVVAPPGGEVRVV